MPWSKTIKHLCDGCEKPATIIDASGPHCQECHNFALRIHFLIEDTILKERMTEQQYDNMINARERQRNIRGNTIGYLRR